MKTFYLSHSSLYDIESLLVIPNETTQTSYYFISVWWYRLKPLIVNPVLFWTSKLYQSKFPLSKNKYILIVAPNIFNNLIIIQMCLK